MNEATKIIDTFINERATVLVDELFRIPVNDPKAKELSNLIVYDALLEVFRNGLNAGEVWGNPEKLKQTLKPKGEVQP